MNHTSSPIDVAIIGGGPAGLMAADVLCTHGVAVHIFDTMPSLGRKFLMAGKSGLNLTHSEPFEDFIKRFGGAEKHLTPALNAFKPQDVQNWAGELGIETFVGTSGRIFPKDFKSAPLLRSWLRRLRANGVKIHVRHRWTGWVDGALRFDTPNGEVLINAKTTVLGLGGASWPSLGSDAAWVDILKSSGISITPLRPANCGFDVAWSDHLKSQHAGAALKNVKLSFAGVEAIGDATITDTGLESGPVYTLSAPLRDAIKQTGEAVLSIDLRPDMEETTLAQALSKPRGKKSWATHLKQYVKIDGAKASLLREATDKTIFDGPNAPDAIAHAIKTVTVHVLRPRPIAEAISSAGGVSLYEVADTYMLKKLPGVFCVGEMLDWEAPTGGYLLSACMATGRKAGEAIKAMF